MSKNGKRIFKVYDPYITSPFGYRINPINNAREFHEAVDYGTNNQKLNQYAITNGRVLSAGTDSLGGKFVYVDYPSLGYVGMHYHLSSIKVKAGDNVDQNTVVGVTGQTGLATGVHLHYGWFKKSEYSKPYYQRNWEDFEQYVFENKLGTPVSRDEDKYQIEVLIDNLRGRAEPNGKILGLLSKGLYNVLDAYEVGGYMWYKIGENLWCAYSSEWMNKYTNFRIGDLIYPIKDVTLSSTAGYSDSTFSVLKKGTRVIVNSFHNKNGMYMSLKDLNGKILNPAAWSKEFNSFEKVNFS